MRVLYSSMALIYLCYASPRYLKTANLPAIRLVARPCTAESVRKLQLAVVSIDSDGSLGHPDIDPDLDASSCTRSVASTDG